MLISQLKIQQRKPLIKARFSHPVLFRCLLKWLEIRSVCPMCNKPIMRLHNTPRGAEGPQDPEEVWSDFQKKIYTCVSIGEKKNGTTPKKPLGHTRVYRLHNCHIWSTRDVKRRNTNSICTKPLWRPSGLEKKHLIGEKQKYMPLIWLCD